MDSNLDVKFDCDSSVDFVSGSADSPVHAVHLGASERGYIYAVARKYVRNEDEAEDVTQDALLQAHRHRASFRGDSHPRTWLYRIAATTALSHLRKQRRLAGRQEAVDPEALAELPVSDSHEDPVVSIERARTAARVRDHLRAIPEGYRRVLELRSNDVSEADIACELGLTVATVKIRGHRARAKLRAVLEHEFAAQAA